MIRTVTSRVLRRIHRQWNDLMVRKRYHRSGPLLVFGESLGDNLLCTAVVRELFARTGERLCILSPYAELFRHHPGVANTRALNWREVQAIKRLGLNLLHPNYNWSHANPDRDTPPSNHIIAEMCGSIGIRGRVTLKSDIHLKEDERINGRVANRQIAIMSSGLSAPFPMLNKEWFVERYQEVVTNTPGDVSYVQIGTRHDPPLAGAIDLRGQLSLRQCAAVLSQSLAFVGQVGFLMHLARAVDCRSVIIYGGREHPDQSGYSCNENLYHGPPCSPCWQRNHCDFDRMCLRAVKVNDVLDALDRTIQVALEPPPVDSASL